MSSEPGVLLFLLLSPYPQTLFGQDLPSTSLLPSLPLCLPPLWHPLLSQTFALWKGRHENGMVGEAGVVGCKGSWAAGMTWDRTLPFFFLKAFYQFCAFSIFTVFQTGHLFDIIKWDRKKDRQTLLCPNLCLILNFCFAFGKGCLCC